MSTANKRFWIVTLTGISILAIIAYSIKEWWVPLLIGSALFLNLAIWTAKNDAKAKLCINYNDEMYGESELGKTCADVASITAWMGLSFIIGAIKLILTFI